MARHPHRPHPARQPRHRRDQSRLRPSPPRHRPRSHHPPHGRSSRSGGVFSTADDVAKFAAGAAGQAALRQRPVPAQAIHAEADDHARAARDRRRAAQPPSPPTARPQPASPPRLRLGHQLRLLPPARRRSSPSAPSATPASPAPASGWTPPVRHLRRPARQLRPPPRRLTHLAPPRRSRHRRRESARTFHECCLA